jgi:hypothetical protein
MQQRGDTPVAIAAVKLRQSDDLVAQRRFVIGYPRRLALGRTVLA